MKPNTYLVKKNQNQKIFHYKKKFYDSFGTSQKHNHLAKNKMGLDVEERRISVEEALAADEVFCAGTAAIVAPIGSINYKDKDYTYCNGKIGKVTNDLYNYLTGIQFGTSYDEFEWMTEI